MKYAITIAIMLSLSFGLVTESFRYQSTAGLWEDDYDLLFDPARIPEIEGARLWTSLANFVTGTEELFSNASVPYILIGGTKNFGRYYPGLVFDKSSSTTALYTGLNDSYGNPLNGDGEVTTVDWTLDSLGNPVSSTTTTETASAFDKENMKDFYVGVGTTRDNLRFGIGFMRNNYNNTYTDPANNYTYDFVAEDLLEDTLTYQETAVYAGDNIYSSTENGLVFSGWMDKERMSVGFTARFDMLSYNTEAVITGDEAEYDNPQQPDTNFTTTTVLNSLTQPESGRRIALDLKLFYDYNENAQGRFYVGFFTRSIDYDDDAADYNRTTTEQSYNDFTWDTVTTATYYDGEKNTKGFKIGTKQLFNVSDRLRFGCGVFFNMVSHDDATTARDTSVTVEVYDNGDGVPGIEDYTYTAWSSETWSTQVSGNVHSFVIPIGLEFYLAKPLVFRLGAQHTMTKNDLTTTRTLVDWEPARTRTEYGDGSVVETIDQTYTEDGSEETDTSTIPRTDYYYGIGWNVTDNLQIDLMGFNELTDLGTWKLSATFKFD